MQRLATKGDRKQAILFYKDDNDVADAIAAAVTVAVANAVVVAMSFELHRKRVNSN